MKAQEPQKSENNPSMDEILQSIRGVINDGHDESDKTSASDEDVLELTEIAPSSNILTPEAISEPIIDKEQIIPNSDINIDSKVSDTNSSQPNIKTDESILSTELNEIKDENKTDQLKQNNDLDQINLNKNINNSQTINSETISTISSSTIDDVFAAQPIESTLEEKKLDEKKIPTETLNDNSELKNNIPTTLQDNDIINNNITHDQALENNDAQNLNILSPKENTVVDNINNQTIETPDSKDQIVKSVFENSTSNETIKNNQIKKEQETILNLAQNQDFKYTEQNINISQNKNKDHLISDKVAEETSNTLKKLINIASYTHSDNIKFRSGTTIEDVVIEAIKPYLSEWLDKNLSLIVKQLVEKEIKKLIPSDD